MHLQAAQPGSKGAGLTAQKESSQGVEPGLRTPAALGLSPEPQPQNHLDSLFLEMVPSIGAQLTSTSATHIRTLAL